MKKSARDNETPNRDRLYRLAERYRERGQFEKAVATYLKIADVQPDWDATRRAATLQLGMHAYQSAARTYESLAVQFEAEEERLRAAFVYRKIASLVRGPAPHLTQEFAGAMRRLEELLAESAATKPRTAAYVEALTELETNRRDEEALDLLHRLVEIDGSNPVCRVRLAEMLYRLDRTREAVSEFRLAAELFDFYERPQEAIRVYERLLHIRANADDAIASARLYLEHGGESGPVRAIAKLALCVQHDAEQLDALALLARAFDVMQQPERALKVRKEMARISRDRGEVELFDDLMEELRQLAPEDSQVVRLAASFPEAASSPAVSVRDAFASVTAGGPPDMQEAIDEAAQVSERPAAGLEFDEISVVSEVWVEPVLPKAVQRALDEAVTFRNLGLRAKAEYVLEEAIDTYPECAELREELCALLEDTSDVARYCEESVALAQLYAERQHTQRARALLERALQASPSGLPEAQAQLEALGAPV